MTSSLAPHDRLIFRWPEKADFSLALLGFLLLSAILHAFGFYLFEVAYPSSVPVEPPPPQLYLLAPSNDENKALLEWIDSQDPSLISQPHEIIPPSVFDVPYAPSFAEVHARPRPMPAEPPPKVAFPPPQQLLSLLQDQVPAQPAADSSILPAPPTELRLSDPLAGRAVLSGLPLPLPVARKSRATLQPSAFLIGVTDAGEVRFIFLRASSGGKEMDDAAEAALRNVRFAPGGDPVTWSSATVYWGAGAWLPPEAK